MSIELRPCSSEIISSGALVRMKESCGACSDSGDSPAAAAAPAPAAPPAAVLGVAAAPARRLLGRNFWAKLFGLQRNDFCQSSEMETSCKYH